MLTIGIIGLVLLFGCLCILASIKQEIDRLQILIKNNELQKNIRPSLMDREMMQ